MHCSHFKRKVWGITGEILTCEDQANLRTNGHNEDCIDSEEGETELAQYPSRCRLRRQEEPQARAVTLHL